MQSLPISAEFVHSTANLCIMKDICTQWSLSRITFLISLSELKRYGRCWQIKDVMISDQPTIYRQSLIPFSHWPCRPDPYCEPLHTFVIAQLFLNHTRSALSYTLAKKGTTVHHPQVKTLPSKDGGQNWTFLCLLAKIGRFLHHPDVYAEWQKWGPEWSSSCITEFTLTWLGLC